MEAKEKLESQEAVSDEEEDGEFEIDENHVSDDGADEVMESEEVEIVEQTKSPQKPSKKELAEIKKA